MGSSQSFLPNDTPPAYDDLEREILPGRPSEDDVASVRAMFIDHMGIPPELIEIILDLAEYWPSVHCTRFLDATFQAQSRPGGSPFPVAEWFYLVSPPVPSTARFVKAVTFGIQSHDQGWGGEPHDRGASGGARSTYRVTDAEGYRNT